MIHSVTFKFLAAGCDGAPLLPLLFIVVNMGFNISLLYLLKISSAVVSCLASTFSGMSFVLSMQVLYKVSKLNSNCSEGALSETTNVAW